MTIEEASEIFSEYTDGERREGFYTVQGRTRSFDAMVRDLVEFADGATVEIIESGLIGWPGDTFIAIEAADGQPMGCGFVS